MATILDPNRGGTYNFRRLYWQGVDEDWQGVLKPFILVGLVMFSIDMIISLASVIAYATFFFRGTASERKTMSFNFYFSLILLAMNLFLWIFFIIGWVTGGIGTSAYLSELMLDIGWTAGLFMLIPIALRWMHIISQFVDTPFSRIASRWSKSKLVRWGLFLNTASISLAGIVLSIVSAIPDDATKDLDPAFQVFPYYVVAITVQAGLYAFQCFLAFIVLTIMAKTMWTIVSLTTEAAAKVSSTAGSGLAMRKRILFLLKLQTVILFLSQFIYALVTVTNTYYISDIRVTEKSQVDLLVTYCSGMLMLSLIIPTFHFGTFLDVRMHMLRAKLENGSQASVQKTPSGGITENQKSSGNREKEASVELSTSKATTANIPTNSESNNNTTTIETHTSEPTTEPTSEPTTTKSENNLNSESNRNSNEIPTQPVVDSN